LYVCIPGIFRALIEVIITHQNLLSMQERRVYLFTGRKKAVKPAPSGKIAALLFQIF